LKTKIKMWTDGSTMPTNPGRGGWSAILTFNGMAKIVGGHETKTTTNQRMEAEAVIGGLSSLKKACEVTIVTDSQYVIYGMIKILNNKMPKANQDIWERMGDAIGSNKIILEKTDGHSDDKYNNLADAYAGYCAENQVDVSELIDDIEQFTDGKKPTRAKIKKLMEEMGKNGNSNL
jgi:ribonuclease HI